ncbi:MAG: BON domain-containing protein [Nitrospira sp.]|nr:BON domain-containing protein [Nitrospira sp.]
MPRSGTIFLETRYPRHPMRLFHRLSLLLPLLLCLSAGCLWPGSSPLPDSPKDALISTTVEAKLAEDQQGGLSGIIVTTEEGTVTLTGTVQKAERKARAAELARQVKGVRRVKNDLDIRADPAP